VSKSNKNKIEWNIERKTFSGKIGNISFYFITIRNHEKQSLWNLAIGITKNNRYGIWQYGRALMMWLTKMLLLKK